MFVFDDIVKITRSEDDPPLTVEYGIVIGRNDQKDEYYDVVISRDDAYSAAYDWVYPNVWTFHVSSLEKVYPNKIAPKLWETYSSRMIMDEIINLTDAVLSNPNVEYEDLHSFDWEMTKQGYDYWFEAHSALCGEEL